MLREKMKPIWVFSRIDLGELFTCPLPKKLVHVPQLKNLRIFASTLSIITRKSEPKIGRK